MKGVVYRDTHEKVWQRLLQLQPQVRDYVAVLSLTVVVDEAEGYAFPRSRPDTDEEQESIPRLVPRTALSFHVSLLLALLRKKLAEFDASDSDTKLVRTFLPESSNEARLVDQIDSYLNKAVELGFLRRVKASSQGRRKLKPLFANDEAELGRQLDKHGFNLDDRKYVALLVPNRYSRSPGLRHHAGIKAINHLKAILGLPRRTLVATNRYVIVVIDRSR